MDNSSVKKQIIRQLAQDAAALVSRLRLVPPVSLDELVKFARGLIKNQPQYDGLLNWAVLLINNAFWRDVVAAVPFRRKLLLIPQCLKHQDCKAQIDEFGLLCESCGACVINEILDFAEGLGMMCMVAEGSTMVAQLIEDGEVDAIIGVSCFEALEKAFKQMISHGVPGLALPLYGAGCKNTSTDVEFLKTIINYHSDFDVGLQHIKPLLSEVREWFDEDGLNAVMGEPRGGSERIARDWLLADGKRYRPFLCVAASVSLGLDATDNLALKKLAVAVECFHKASLVHDDIEDDDATRYDQPTLHMQHGMPVALNTGDLLLGEGYRMISELPLLPARKAVMLQIAVDGHLELCRGQGEELLCCRRRRHFTPSELVEVFRQKTAPAFNVAFQFAAALTKSTKLEKTVLHLFSEHLGIGYQILDDLQDTSQDSADDCKPSIVDSYMTDENCSYEQAVKKARELFELHKKQALLALRPLRNFNLKRLLFQVTHSILKD